MVLVGFGVWFGLFVGWGCFRGDFGGFVWLLAVCLGCGFDFGGLCGVAV